MLKSNHCYQRNGKINDILTQMGRFHVQKYILLD